MVEPHSPGEPSSGDAADPLAAIRGARLVFGIVGALTTLSAVAVRSMGAADGILPMIEGVLFLCAAFGAHRRSEAAVWAGTALLALDTVFILVDAVESGGAVAVGRLVGVVILRTVFFVVLARAIRAFARLRAAELAARGEVLE